MLRLRALFLAFVVGVLPTLACPSDAEAGPLLDWIRNRCRKTSCAQPTGFAQVAPNAYGLQPGQCLKTCQQTCSRTVVNYVPHTAYRTEWKRVPVTQYRPVTSSDPCTGCTITCMKPCTTYTYQCQRVPYTTYRPEYRTETYQVPVTTLVNDCATGNCAPECPACVAPGVQMPGNFAPAPAGSPNGTYYEYPATNPPRGAVISPSGTYNTNIVPADMQPTLAPQSSVRPVIDSLRSEPTRTIYTQPTPTNYNQPAVGYEHGGHTAQTPARKEWNYVPTRLASHTTSNNWERNDAPVGMQPISRRSNDRFEATPRTDLSSIRMTNQGDDLNGWKLVK